MSKKRIMSIILTAVAGLWFMLPVIGGVLHIGMVYPAAVFGIILLILIFPEKFKGLWNGKARIFVRILCGLLCLFILAVVTVMGFMGYAALRPVKSNATVIVLGCQVRGERLSRMLKGRADRALEYLKENPDSVCIASGGQGKGENMSEGEAVRRYLVSKGIAEERIYVEGRSTSTYENLKFSADMIRENGLCTDVVIASDNFHQLRASMFAEKNGLNASPLGSCTWIYLSAGYWTREVLAVARAVVFGH